MWGALPRLVDSRSRTVTAVAVAILAGCAGSGEDSSSRPNVWFHLSKDWPKEAVSFWTYVYDGGGYSTGVTLLRAPEGAENPCDDPTMGEDCTSAWRGPRRVGDVSQSEWSSLEVFLSDERWATYEADSHAPPEGVGEPPDEVITVTRWEYPNPHRWVSLVPGAVLYPETEEMLGAMVEMQRRWHDSGEYMTATDRQLDSEYDWPVP